MSATDPVLIAWQLFGCTEVSVTDARGNVIFAGTRGTPQSAWTDKARELQTRTLELEF